MIACAVQLKNIFRKEVRFFFYFLFLQTHIDKLSVKMYNYI